MVTFNLLVLGIALFLYIILGGADFGAGILEIFTGKRSQHTITKAIAPVWEANHIWLILVVVILFNAFPKVYATLSNSLHIPIMILLLGIILRGTAFTFRHYDVEEEGLHNFYSFFFRLSSFFTPFCLGIILGAMILGDITLDTSQGFFIMYIAPWFNPFCFAMGGFIMALCSYLAAIFLLGETQDRDEILRFHQLVRRTMLISLMMGAAVFTIGWIQDAPIATAFWQTPVTWILLIVASLFLPFILGYLRVYSVWRIRRLVVLQLGLILLGWAWVQYPVFIYLSDGHNLTIENCQAPAATFQQLTIAIVIGLLIIFPALGYLFRIFKLSPNTTAIK